MGFETRIPVFPCLRTKRQAAANRYWRKREREFLRYMEELAAKKMRGPRPLPFHIRYGREIVLAVAAMILLATWFF